MSEQLHSTHSHQLSASIKIAEQAEATQAIERTDLDVHEVDPGVPAAYGSADSSAAARTNIIEQKKLFKLYRSEAPFSTTGATTTESSLGSSDANFPRALMWAYTDRDSVIQSTTVTTDNLLDTDDA